MKLSIFILMPVLLISTSYAQQFCSDSSYRMKYKIEQNGFSYIHDTDTTGVNIFAGNITNTSDIVFFKTTWGDTILWAKKIIIEGSPLNIKYLPNGEIIFVGVWFGNSITNKELLVGKLDKKGNALWLKRIKLAFAHYAFGNGNYDRTLLVEGNNIYFVATFFDIFSGTFSNVIKIDLNGNLLWNSSFNSPFFNNAGLSSKPIILNNIIYLLGAENNNSLNGHITTITELNDNDGTFIASLGLKQAADTYVKDLYAFELKNNTDGSFSLVSFIQEKTMGEFPGYWHYALFDNNFNTLKAEYYRTSFVLDPGSDLFSFNNNNQYLRIARAFDLVTTDNYFFTFDHQGNQLQSRKFNLPIIFSTQFRNDLKLDDKQNIHFTYGYNIGGINTTEYARISNFAPQSTANCFGKDTNVLVRYPLAINKVPFAWDNIQQNTLTINDVPIVQDTAFVTKELVCKQVSVCDSVHIQGPGRICIGQPVRYVGKRNSQCLKSIVFNIDTSFVTIINTEGDTAINLKFKKAFNGYLHAALYNCVVKDSFKIVVEPSPIVAITNKQDSLLCPGKTIPLNATRGFTSYLWQNGNTDSSITINQSGLYKVTATSYCTIASADSVLVSFSDTSLNVPPTQTICRYDTAYISFPNNLTSLLWQPLNKSIYSNNTLWLFPVQTTQYQIVAQRQINCPITKQTQVIVKNCEQVMYIPNAFTPNGDALNNTFKPLPTQRLLTYSFKVLNRYGQLLFQTNNPANGWDGNFNGKKQPVGAYVYLCTYYFPGKKEETDRGTFILIR